MKRGWDAWLLGGALIASVPMVAAPALADVKAGVDAWQQGDYAKAVAQWRPLAQNGDADAQFNLGQAYKLGRGVPADLPQAADWYRRAAAQGHLHAEDNLGLVMFQQGDRTTAMPYLQRAAMRGEPRAQYLVGTALFNGDLLAKDWVRAYALMTRAAAAGLPQATTSLQSMDKYVPEDQRKQGLALAATMDRQGQEGALAAAPVMSAPAPRPAPAPSGVRTTDIPASATPPANSTSVEPPVRPQPAPAQTVARPRPAPPAPTRTAAGGSWRVQLGAFGEEGRAKALWTQLSSRVRSLGALQPYLVKDGRITRLQAGPLASAAEAGRLCGTVKAAGADCLPKKP